MLKKTLITTALLVLATPALAETVNDHYKTVIEQTPYRVEVCKDVQLQGQASTGDTIFGAIIGGAIGNQFGGGKGKDAATILGAILGADFANKKGGQQKIVGYKQVEQCEVTYEKTYQTITRCDVTVSIPAIKGVTHTYVTDTCPANNTKVKLVTSLSIQRR